MLAGCSSAAASEPTAIQYVASVSKAAPPAPLTVEAIANDEISHLAALGYPTTEVTWQFVEDTGHLGTGYATWPSTVLIDTDIPDWAQFDGDLDTVVRSTVRHEYAHTMMYASGISPSDSGIRAFCPDPIEDRFTDAGANLGQECMAEAMSLVLSEQRDEPRFALYGLTSLLDTSVAHAERLIGDYLTR